MKIHYCNAKGEEIFINNVVHLQNVDNNIFEALLTNGKEITIVVSRIEGIADINLLEKTAKNKR